MKKLKLTKGLEAIVSDSDYKRVSKYKWTASQCKKEKYYAVRAKYVNGKRKTLYLHRFIMGVIDGSIQVDHINGDALDCRRSNMRICNNAQNNRNRGLQSNNSSGVAGVSFNKFAKKWHARIKVDKKTIHLGYFENIEGAIKAREQAEIKYFGEFRNKLK